MNPDLSATSGAITVLVVVDAITPNRVSDVLRQADLEGWIAQSGVLILERVLYGSQQTALRRQDNR